MLRVLRPGGTLMFAECAHLADYRMHLETRGVTGVKFSDDGWHARVFRLLSGGSYRAQAPIARHR